MKRLFKQTKVILVIAFCITITLFTIYFGNKNLNSNYTFPCKVEEISPVPSIKVKEPCGLIRANKL